MSFDLWPQGAKRYEKLYLEGNKYFSIGEFDLAIEYFNKSLNLNPDYCPSIYKLGLSYKNKNLYRSYVNWFLSYNDKLCKENSDEVSFLLAEYFFLTGKFDESLKFLDRVSDTLKFVNFSKYKNYINYNLNESESILITFDALDSIRSSFYQYSPIYNKQNNTLYFTVRSGSNLLDDEDVYMIRSLSELNSVPFEIVNSSDNEGTPTFLNGGDFMIYTSCKMNFKKNSCDLFYSIKQGGKWFPPKKLDENINSDYWDSQPFMYDSTLYFVSNRPGGKGGRDIYFSKLQKDGSWSVSENFVSVNSQYDEVSPFVEDKVFYFSSNSNNSYGGYDIYALDNLYSEKESIKNLGSRINSFLDETSIFIHDSIIFLTVENKIVEKVKSQIIIGQILSEFKSEAISYKFNVFDDHTKEKIHSQLYIRSMGGNSIEIENFDFRNLKNDSLVIVETRNYFPLLIKNINSDTTFFMTRIEDKFVFDKIYFEFDSYELNQEAQKYLIGLSKWLENITFEKLEISGHTDNVGSEEYNFNLSEKRAKSVFDFLRKLDPDLENIVYLGYGNSVPIISDYDGEKNRRIEFKISIK